MHTFGSTILVSCVSQLLFSIPRLCSNLQTFTVNSWLSNNLVLEPAVFQATCSMHSLRTLHLGSLKPPNGMMDRILHHLGHLTSLETLRGLYIPTEIQSLDESDLILRSFGMANHWFQKLRHLSLRLQDFDSAALLMDSMHLPFLSLAFSLRLSGQPKPHSPRKLFQSLARNSHLPLSLSSIEMLGDVRRPFVRDVDDAETASIFQPLLALTNLQTLSLRLSGVEKLDDAWLNRASKGFPQLRRLTLHGHAVERKRITLAGYVPLLQNCPRLRWICTATACKSFDTRKALPAALCNENLTAFSCSKSSIESPVASIFRCLIRMFPNLNLLFIPSSFPSEEARKSWTDLQQLVLDSQKY